jgi:uncharacterized delta-60 repeat protein
MKIQLNSVIFVLFFCNISSLFTQTPGSLDYSFGDWGIQKISYSGQIVSCNDAAYQSDGKIVLIGYKGIYEPIKKNAYAVRIDESGDIDYSFGNLPGYFGLNLGSNSEAKSIHVLPNDKILIAGNVGQQVFLMRLTPNGSLDYTFSDGVGYVIYEGISSVESILVTNEGGANKIYLGGYKIIGYNIPMLIKTDDQGVLDHSFAFDEEVFHEKGRGIFRSLDWDESTGQIFACGSIGSVGSNSLVAKFNPNGSLINTFGDQGLLLVPAPNGGTISGCRSMVADQTNHFITVFGRAYKMGDGSTDFDICAFRINFDGTWNYNFGVNGWSYLLLKYEDHINDVVQQSDGKFYFGGSTLFYNEEPGTDDFFLGRIKQNGFIDQVFGNTGYTTMDFGDSDMINALLLDEQQGTLLAIGYQKNIDFEREYIVAARYHTGFLLSQVDATKFNKLDISPNPIINNKFSIQLDKTQSEPQKITILDINGIIIYQNDLSHLSSERSKYQIELPDFIHSGIYFVLFQNGDLIYQEKIIIN